MIVQERVVRTVKVNRELIGLLRLPMVARVRRGMTTICAACRERIVDEYFLGGFFADRPNAMFHEGCVAQADKDRWLKKERHDG